MKKAIITFGVGYAYDDIKYFLQSCNQHVPDAHIYLYVGDNIEELREQCKYYAHLHLIRFNEKLVPKAIAKALQFVPPLRKLYCSFLSFSQRRNLFSKEVLYATTSPLLQFMVKRFFLIEQLLSTNDCDYVMVTDLRDVLLQDDPFAHVAEDVIITGSEPRKIEESEINSRWIRKTYSEEVLNSVKHKDIVCAGVTVGSVRAIKQYVAEMNQDVFENLGKIAGLLGPDQAIHIRLFYEGLKGLRKYLQANGLGSIATLHYSKLTEFNVDGGRLKNVAGKRLAVVHQYDRHPALADALRQSLKPVAPKHATS